MGFVAFYVSSVVVFAFVLLCKVSFPIVYILTCSDLYVFGIILIWYIAYAFRYFLDYYFQQTTILCSRLESVPRQIRKITKKNTLEWWPKNVWKRIPLLFFIYFTITGVKKIIPYTEDFVI